MPIYDCRCRRCGAVSEVFVRRPDAEPAKCPNCGSESLEKLPSAFGVLHTGTSEASTCCGRDTRCDSPPCSGDDVCRRR